MFIDYIHQLPSIEFLLLIHMASNIAVIYIVAGWMAGYVSRQKGYWSSISAYLRATLIFGLPIELGSSMVIPKGNHSTTEVVMLVTAVEIGSFLVLFAADSESNPTLNKMKEKLDSFPGWRYWFDGDKQSQLVSALHVAITREKAVRNVSIISIVQTMLILALIHEKTLASLHGIPENPPKNVYFSGGIFFATASIIVLTRINRITCERAMPGVALIHHGLEHIVRCGNEQQPGLHIRIARWRNPEHRRLFQLSDALEKCIYPVRRKVSQADFDTISTAFSALALAVRSEATRFKSEGQLRADVLSWMCITLAINTNPVQAAKRISALLPNETSMVQPLPQSRVSDTLGRINDALSQNTRIFVALAIIFVVTYYVATGNLAKLFEFLESAAVS